TQQFLATFRHETTFVHRNRGRRYGQNGDRADAGSGTAADWRHNDAWASEGKARSTCKQERIRTAQVHRHIIFKTFATTSPSVSNIATQAKAEAKLAIWKRQNGIAKAPATRGTTARRGPENRPMKMASGPHLATKRSPRGRRSGCRDSGQIWATVGPS